MKKIRVEPYKDLNKHKRLPAYLPFFLHRHCLFLDESTNIVYRLGAFMSKEELERDFGTIKIIGEPRSIEDEIKEFNDDRTKGVST